MKSYAFVFAALLAASLGVSGIAYAQPGAKAGQASEKARGAAAAVEAEGWDPTAPPVDLGVFTQQAARSLALVSCGGRTATAWALADIVLHPDAQAMGHKTMLVTSFGAIENCRSEFNRNVTMTYAGAQSRAYVWSWDTTNGLASVHTDVVIPGLRWDAVPRPTPQQWVAAVSVAQAGGPVASTGAVTSVAETGLGVSFAQQQDFPGAPVMDNFGFVLATMGSTSSFGQVAPVGGPALCAALLICGDDTEIWMAYTVPGAVGSLRATPLKGALRIAWRTPPGTTKYNPPGGFQYRVGTSAWTSTDLMTAVIRGLRKGRQVTVEVRAVNFMGPGPVTRVSARPK